jgi:hypothetical protein
MLLENQLSAVKFWHTLDVGAQRHSVALGLFLCSHGPRGCLPTYALRFYI